MNLKWYHITLATIFLLVSLAPILTTHPPTKTNPDNQLAAPSITHPFGTDYLGRDVWSRTLYGGRRTLLVSALATVIAVSVGTLLGLLGSVANQTAKPIADVALNTLLSLPSLITALVILSLLGRGSLQIAIAVGISQIAFYGRVAQGACLTTTTQDYLLAAEALGANTWGKITRHILPNAQATLLAYAGIVFSYSITNSAALSLLGLGQNPSLPDWGIMLADGRNAFRVAPLNAVIPGIAIALTIISVNKIVDDITR